MIQQLLYKYLILNGRLGIPEIGNLVVLSQPAQINNTGTILDAPVNRIGFHSTAVTADKNLFEFLSRELDVDEVTAISRFNDWVQEWKHTLTETSVAILPSIGSIRKTPEGAYGFEPSEPDISYPSMTLPSGVVWAKEGEQDDEPVVDTDSGWWIYAIIFLLLGIAAIAYKYL